MRGRAGRMPPTGRTTGRSRVAVVVPWTVEAGVEAVAVCREHGAPVLSRGGGTSLAGQSTNTAVVLDWTKHCTGLVSVDPRARTCVVEPGIVLDDLNAELARYGLKFGPKPATHNRCAIGGMIGNNSCGSTAQAYGKTVDNIRRLEVLRYDGLRFWAGPTSDDEVAAIAAEGGPRAQLYRGLRGLAERYGDEVRERYPDIPRRVSGYNLDALADGFDVARLLVGSEGTLVTVLHAELELVPTVEHTAIVVLGYPDIVAAADVVPSVLAACEVAPMQLEALDRRLVEILQHLGVHQDSIRILPDGHSWLMLQFGGDTDAAADDRARHVLEALGKSTDDADVALTDDPEREATMMAAREAGLGVTARAPLMHAPGRAARTRRCPRTGSGTTCATCGSCFTSSTSTSRRCTGTSGTAVCTPASLSGSSRPPASSSSAGSPSAPPTSSSPMVGSCPVSTATANPAASCWSGSSAPIWSARSASSRRCSTRTTG